MNYNKGPILLHPGLLYKKSCPKKTSAHLQEGDKLARCLQLGDRVLLNKQNKTKQKRATDDLLDLKAVSEGGASTGQGSHHNPGRCVGAPDDITTSQVQVQRATDRMEIIVGKHCGFCML